APMFGPICVDQARTSRPAGSTSNAPPGTARYHTGVPFRSSTMAYGADVWSADAVRLPVRYQPGGGWPGWRTARTGKSWGRHRIQYLPPPPAAATTTAW